MQPVQTTAPISSPHSVVPQPPKVDLRDCINNIQKLRAFLSQSEPNQISDAVILLTPQQIQTLCETLQERYLDPFYEPTPTDWSRLRPLVDGLLKQVISEGGILQQPPATTPMQQTTTEAHSQQSEVSNSSCSPWYLLQPTISCGSSCVDASSPQQQQPQGTSADSQPEQTPDSLQSSSPNTLNALEILLRLVHKYKEYVNVTPDRYLEYSRQFWSDHNYMSQLQALKEAINDGKIQQLDDDLKSLFFPYPYAPQDQTPPAFTG